jgi:hypothetical protein
LKERRCERWNEFRNFLINSIKTDLEKNFKENKETSKIFWHSSTKGIKFDLTIDGQITAQSIDSNYTYARNDNEKKATIRDFSISKSLQTSEDDEVIKEYLKLRELSSNSKFYHKTKEKLQSILSEKLRKKIDNRFGNENSFVVVNVDGYKYPVKIIVTHGSCLNFEFDLDQDGIQEINI